MATGEPSGRAVRYASMASDCALEAYRSKVRCDAGALVMWLKAITLRPRPIQLSS